MGTQTKGHPATISAATPVVEAARDLIAERLSTVRERLRKALKKPQRRRQQIHALRVATRRATAAIDLFRDCLPKPIRTEVRATLRSLRKAVAEARDWDVLLQQLAKTISDADADAVPTLDMLTGYALAHRGQAQSALEEVARDRSPQELKKLEARVVAAVRWKRKGQPTLGDFARPRIGQQLRDLTTIADRDNDAWTMLHEVRIAGKRLRYSLEVVDGCLDPAVSDHVAPALVRLQEVPGGVNDSFHASELFEAILSGMRATTPAAADRYQSVLEHLIAEHQQRMQSGREAFDAWLHEWHSPEMQRTLKAITPGHPRSFLPAQEGIR